jgi:hypothetical protein
MPKTNNKERTMINVKITLKGDYYKKIKELKDYYGFSTYTELLRILITEKHREIKKKE